MTLNTPFHYDYVGSLLRPEKLKQARNHQQRTADGDGE